MKKTLTFILCAVMIFTSIPFSLTAGAAAQNPLKKVSVTKAITLLYDTYNKNSTKTLTLKATGETEGEAVTDIKSVEWRTLSTSVATVEADKTNDMKAVVTAKGTGTTKIVATVKNKESKEFQAVCEVTVRKSIRSYYEPFRTIMAEIPDDIDDKPVKYSDASLELLKSTFSDIQSFFGTKETAKTILKWRDDLVTLVGKMEDTEENCKKVNSWKKSVMTAVSTLSNSVLASKSDTEFFGKWNKAYAKVPADIANNVYTDATAKAVTDIIDEYKSTQWLANAESKAKIDALAASLESAVNGLKKHTTKFEFKKTKITATYGSGSFKISYTKNGSDTITWSTSDKNIVTVDKKGYVTIVSAIPKGYSKKVTVKAVVKDAAPSKITQTCEIVILNPVSSISVSSAYSILLGNTKKISVSVQGVDKKNPVTETPTFKFVSDNEKVAKVKSDGTIVPVAKGKCTVTVSIKNNSLVEPVKCTVTVSQAKKVSKLVPAGVPSQVTVNATAQAKVYVYPTDATNKKIKWTSSNTKVAKVTGVTTDELSYATANIKGIKSGSATITYEATDGSGAKGSFKITVNPLVSEIEFDKENIFVYIGDGEFKIKATCKPENAGNQKLIWFSSDDMVASVTNGKVTLNATGTCEIVARTQDGSNVSKTTNLRVLGSAESIKISKAPSTMKTGETLDLNCKVVTKQGISYQVHDWTVSDRNLATVDSDGVVKALKPGKVKVTATYFDGTIATKTITITAGVEGVSLPAALTLSIGKSKTITPTFTPDYATNKNVKWTSSDSKVVSVSNTGVITAAGVGTAVITVKTEEGGYISTCKVTVIQPVTGVELNKTKYTLTIGKKETVKLKATVSPSTATKKDIFWKSEDTSVVTVSSSGLVTAKGPGSVKVIATTADGGYTAECLIKVNKPVKSIKFSSSKSTYYVGEKRALTVVFKPADASNKKLTFKTSNKSIATVNSKGVVTAKKKGSCTITAKSVDGNFKATCTIKVIGKINVQSIKITKSAVSINKGKTKQLKVEFTPTNAAVRDLKWSSSDKSIASVNSNGVVTAHKGGTCTITCTSLDTDVSSKCKVTVNEKPTGLTLNASTLTLDVGKTKILTASVQPSSATEKSVKWSSSDTEIATVSSSGKITALKTGTCTIKVRSKSNPDAYAKCVVTVIQPPKKIKLSETNVEVVKGDKVAVLVTVSPKNAYTKDVVWSSNRTSVATVSADGVITGRNSGSAVITCTSAADPNVKAICNVTVLQPVTGITLSADNLTLTTGRTKTLVATVTPEKASNKKVTFKTDNKDVAKVNSRGVVEAVGPGTATITARTEDGFYTAKCVVTVIEAVRSIKLDKTSMTIELDKSKTLTATIKPKNATNKEVMWRSSNPLIARVTQDGKVTALKEGTVTITCTTIDGGYTASCTVKCVIPVDAVTINYKDITIKKGSSKTLKAKVYPAEATNQSVKWSTSDKSVATVDANGVVKAVGKGVCIITCTTVQGGKKAYCGVEVK